jgi:hypothetical protein
VEWIASEIRRLVEEEFVRLSDILVVFRTDYEFREIPELLQSKLSPGSISGFVRVYGPRGDRDAYIFREGHLTLSTIFSAKGYDVPVVFLAGVDRLTTTEQDRALFYVGATRAKHMLYVSGTTARGQQTELLAEAARVLKVQKSRTQRIATAQLSPGPMIKTVQNIRLGGVPYGWMKIYETLLFGFYNPRTGQCFPSHKAIAIKARCGVRTVQRALKWARENNLIQWSHGLVRDGWRVLRTSNRYAFSAFLTIRRIIVSIAASNGQRRRGILTSYKSLAYVAIEAKSFSFPAAPSQLNRT